jgi:magnesium chelatase family protein
VHVPRVAFVELTNRNSDESSAIVRDRVIAAREVLRETRATRSMRPLTLLDQRAQELLWRAAARLGLSARAVCRTASVAVTVAALRGNASRAQDVAEALRYRPLGPTQRRRKRSHLERR